MSTSGYPPLRDREAWEDWARKQGKETLQRHGDEERCSVCRFASPALSGPGADRHSCQRHAPTVPDENRMLARGRLAVWPIVDFCDWCGEFEPYVTTFRRNPD